MAATKILQLVLTDAATSTEFTLTDSTLIVVQDDTLGAQITYERDGCKVEQHTVTGTPWTLGGTSIHQGGADTRGTSGVLFPITRDDGKIEWINHLRIQHREPWTDGVTRTKIEYNSYGARNTYFHVQETMAELTATITSRNLDN